MHSVLRLYPTRAVYATLRLWYWSLRIVLFVPHPHTSKSMMLHHHFPVNSKAVSPASKRVTL